MEISINALDNDIFILNDIGVLVHNMCAAKDTAEYIQWLSSKVNNASRLIDSGHKKVYVDTREQAEELFLRKYQGAGYRNTTGWKALESNFWYNKAGYYHLDDVFDEKGTLLNHAKDNPD